jgi:hypothetical protein
MYICGRFAGAFKARTQEFPEPKALTLSERVQYSQGCATREGTPCKIWQMGSGCGCRGGRWQLQRGGRPLQGSQILTGGAQPQEVPETPPQRRTMLAGGLADAVSCASQATGK